MPLFNPQGCHPLLQPARPLLSSRGHVGFQSCPKDLQGSWGYCSWVTSQGLCVLPGWWSGPVPPHRVLVLLPQVQRPQTPGAKSACSSCSSCTGAPSSCGT